MNSRLDTIQDADWEALATKMHYTPESMAACCSVSLRQLERFFKRHFDETPESWLLRLRCRHAIELLRRGYKTVDAAKDLKFGNPSHFCRAFKKLQGRSPQGFAPPFRLP